MTSFFHRRSTRSLSEHNFFLKVFGHRAAPAAVLLFYLLLYLLFPSGYSTTDGWNYAAEIKHSGSLFHPYHLLYNLLGYFFCYLPAKAGADILGCLKAMNSVFAVLSLLAIIKIALIWGMDRITAVAATIASGASFSVIRFATENETYIVPLAFGLAATFWYISFLGSGRWQHAFFSASAASFAVLFHISCLFWWLVLPAGFIYRKSFRAALIYMVSSLIIPLVYCLAIYVDRGFLTFEAVRAFMLGDFLMNSELGISGHGLLLSFINLVRSFIQVHGYMFHMAESNILFVLPALISLLIFIFALFFLPSVSRRKDHVAGILAAVFILQYALAVLSYGNSEFMVMIPVLIFLVAGSVLVNPAKFIILISAAMLVWNISYGLVPGKYGRNAAADYLADRAVKESGLIVIAADDQLLKSVIYYRTGIKDAAAVFQSPAVMEIKGYGSERLAEIIGRALSEGKEVIGDCTGKQQFSRASVLEGDINSEFFSRYQTEVIFHGGSIKGSGTVSRITGLKEE